MDQRPTFSQSRVLLGVQPGADARTLRRAFATAASRAQGDEPALRRLIAAWRLLDPPPVAANDPAFLPAPAPRDFRTDLSVGACEALKGEERLVSIPGAGTYRLRVPAGARDGVMLRLAGRAPGGGDVLIRLRVRSTPSPRASARDLIRRFSGAWAA